MVKKPAPPSDGIEQDFMLALARVAAGNPTNPALAKRAKRGTLEVNISTVAREAGHSRTLISHDKCAYPQVRVAVLAYRQPAGEPTSLSELNRNLRQENAELRRTVKLARESMAAMALRMERVVRNAEREIAAARRREKRGDRDPNQVAGLSSVLPTPTDGVVLEFKPERSKDA
ncbi:MAG: hypothetical protein A3E01_14135 [Gammaproteobacteria bacterium RIFCSPHIGHO2_12_FULL_63_22]|nr:MAG: hypothetical protein A3E01_14135 [Gammaproteobacteria bacterium RIFCSPHIGHO2_12_FULL_63_22]